MPHRTPAPAPPARPFSPSPPRENRHSSSRPPSLLFGAPPTATSSVGLVLGLPPSPSPRLSPFPGAGAPNAPPSYFEHEPRRRRRSSSSSVSTTSSASPPLGATPILAALEPAPISMPRTQRDGSVDDFSPSSTFPGEDRAPAPTAPHAARAASRSMPRIHQPTVLRTPSGRGLSWVPQGEGTRSRHASMLSNAVASGQNHATSSSSASSLAGVLARSVAVAATASSIGIPDRLEAAERVPRERVSAASLTSVDSAGSEFEDTFGRQKAARAAAKLGGASVSRARPALDIPPVPPLPPQFAAAQQQRPVRTDDGASRSAWEPSPAVAAPATASTTTLDSYDISIDYDQRFGDDDNDDDDMDTTIDETPELHEVGENNSTPATTPHTVYRSPPPSARSAASSKFHTPESRSSARFYTPDVKDDADKWRVDEDAEHSLNEVKDPNAVASASSSSSAAKTPTVDKTAYVPPYEPRRKHGKQQANGLGPAVALSPSSKRPASPAPAPSPLGDDSAALSLTLIASLGGASGDPLALSRRRVELSLAWLASPPPSWWDYVPFAQYAPRWTIRLATGASGRERAAGKRRAVATSPTTPNTPPRRRDREADGIVQAVVGNLPIVGRFATWL